MKASGKIGSNGVKVSDNVEKRFETDVCTRMYVVSSKNMCPALFVVVFVLSDVIPLFSLFT
jgi:hypothetical protein